MTKKDTPEVQQRITALEKELSAAKKNIEDFYTPLTELTNEALFLVDRHCRYLFITDSMAFRFDAPIKEVVGRSYCDFHEKDAADIFAARVAEVFATGLPVVDEHRDRFSQKDIYRRFCPVKSARGEVRKVAVIGQDITRLKETEQSRLESERMLAALLANLPGMAYRCRNDQDWTMEFLSEGCFKLTGYVPADLLANARLSYNDLILPQDRQYVWDGVQEGIAHRLPYQFSYRIQTARGEIKWVWEQGNGIYDEDGGVVALEGFIADITERAQAEEALKESESTFRSLAEQSFVGIVIMQDGVFKYVNPTYAAIHGYTVNELLDNFPVMNLVPPEDRQRLTQRIAQRTTGEIGSSHHESRKVRKNGEIIDVEVYGAPGSYNNRPAVIGVLVDMTQRKRAEEANRSLLERLHRAEKMEALGTLAGGVAHDLNNILGVLVGYSELLLHKIPVGDPTRDFVKNILASSEKGASIVQDLLTLARRGVTVMDVINLEHLIVDFLKTPVYERLQTHHPRVTFRTDFCEDLLNIKGSPVHLEKTVMNLVSNAAESIAAAGEVVIRTENRYLDTALRGYDQVEEGEYVVLTVSDSGVGIGPKDIDKMFEPFYTKKVMGRSGTGLGLAVVWGTVKDHKGYINVESEPGQGSTFSLYFPATRERVNGDAQAISMEHYQGRGESILVVDDVREQREMAAGILGLLGYQVRTVAGGEDAVADLKTHPADLVLLDMIMDPGIDGLETYRRILKINPQQKVILVSGFSETDRVRKARKLGARRYIRKPYLLEKIGLAIRQELEHDGDG